MENIFSPDFGKKPGEVNTQDKATSFEEYTESLSFDRFLQVDAIINAGINYPLLCLHHRVRARWNQI
jgi:hypothetical protein